MNGGINIIYFTFTFFNLPIILKNTNYEISSS